MSDPARYPIETARRLAGEALPGSGDPYAVLLGRGSLELGYYIPQGEDHQPPHDQDELYVVMAGTGTFLRGDERIPFQTGDALFVAAGTSHRFTDFTDDLQLWVVFWGPPGGELPIS